VRTNATSPHHAGSLARSKTFRFSATAVAAIAAVAGTRAPAMSKPPTAPAPAPTEPTMTVLRDATFDSLPTGQVTPAGFQSQLGGDYSSTAPYEDTFVVAVAGRGNVLHTRLEANTIVNSPAGTNGSTMVLALPKVVYSKACISYDVRFTSGFDWSLGGKLPGLSGVRPGVSPSAPSGGNYVGDDGWSGRMMWLTPKSYSWAGPTNMGVNYMYYPAQADKYGDHIRWNKQFVAGQWHTIRTCYTMNTVGRSDGKLETWFDGAQVVSNTAFQFRTRSDVGVSHIMWSIFRGGNTMDWAGSTTGYVDIDNVLITGA